jgi:ribonuclease HI
MLEEWLEANNLVILNDGTPTRYDEMHGTWTAIDLTLATTSLAPDMQWQVHDDSWGSDHMPIISHIGLPPALEEEQTRAPTWNFAKANWPLFHSNCLKIEEESVTSDDPQAFCTNLTEAILAATRGAIPLTTAVRGKQTVPWWSKEIHQARQKRKKALNRSKRDKMAKKLVRETRNHATNLIKQSKEAAWNDFCGKLNDKTNSKEVWGKIRAIKGGRRANPIPRLQGDKTTLGKANLLAKHFANISSNDNYSQEFRDNISAHSDPPKQEPHPELAMNALFTTHELASAIANKKGTAPGEDMTSYELFKNMPPPTLALLVQLYNLIWEKGEVPTTWKHSVVVPIPKAGKDPKEPNSYRPISLTSNMCKAMEAMVTKRLNHHLETEGHISPDQSGFRKGHSTIDHIVRLENDIRMAQIKRQYLAAIFLDFSKAFDMVWHQGLLQKLAHKAVKGRMANFIQSFLEDRSLSVRVGKSTSDALLLQNGTPQGSIISPTLFNIMIDDLFHEVSRRVSTAKFADDGTLWIQNRNISRIRTELQQSLDTIGKWCDKWGFKLSLEKTVGVLFKRKGMEQHIPRLSINGTPVEFRKEAKFLGVIFDQHLTWSKHVDNLVVRCKKDLNVLRAVTGTSWGASRETLLTLYRTLIRSKLDYGCEAIQMQATCIKQRLDSIQYKALKIALGAISGTSLAALQAETGELPLDLRREQLTLNYWARTHNQLVSRTWETPLTRRHLILTKKHHAKPFGLRVKELVEEYKCQDLKPVCKTEDSPAPWQLKPPFVDTSLTHLVDKNENPTQAKALALEKIHNQWDRWTHVYTDGSKDPASKHVGYGVYCNDDQKARISKRLPNGQSVFTAELQAIDESLRVIPKITNNTQVVILSDSLSALQAIQSGKSHSRPKLLSSLLQKHTVLANRGYHIQLCWIPSHVGIAGNEGADKLARNSLSQPYPQNSLPHSTQEIKSHIRETVEKNGTTSGNQLNMPGGYTTSPQMCQQRQSPRSGSRGAVRLSSTDSG